MADLGKAHNLPPQLTNFVGRESEIDDLRSAIAVSRLVTLTGAGGVGKTRLVVELAAVSAFEDGVWFVDLAPIMHPDLVAVTVARALGLVDQPGQSPTDRVLAFVRDRSMLVVLDNCEHVLDACARLVVLLLASAPALKVCATSREPINVAGEAVWQVPSLSVDDDAVALFADRARLAMAHFALTDESSPIVAEICRRLDGIPLAIELAAARVRALSLAEILDGLHDRFRLLTGGSRTAVHRQQTLRASVDWSHALLTDVERILFRRLGVFFGGFDLDAARAVAGCDGLEPDQVLDQLMLLVDKSLVVAENTGPRTRYRLLETIRQYALEQLGESGEAESVRIRHSDHYAAMVRAFDEPTLTGQQLDRAEQEIDNLRGAFGWSLENADAEWALAMASSLHPLWLSRGRLREGLAWLDVAFDKANHASVSSIVRTRAVADRCVLRGWVWGPIDVEEVTEMLTVARGLNDPATLIRALIAYAAVVAYDTEAARPCLVEAAQLARDLRDSWRLSEILGMQAVAAMAAGDPNGVLVVADEARPIVDAIGDRFGSRQVRWATGWALSLQGDLVGGLALNREVIDEADVVGDLTLKLYNVLMLGFGQAWLGDVVAARDTADLHLRIAAESGDIYEGASHTTSALAWLSGGDAAAAWQSFETARGHTGLHQLISSLYSYAALAPLVCGDVTAARQWADDVVAVSQGCYLSVALTSRARVAIAEGALGQADRDAREALSIATATGTLLGVPSTLECLADVAAGAGRHLDAGRLLGAADAVRRRTGEVRFKVLDAGYRRSIHELREVLGEKQFDVAWAEGGALSTEEALAYAQRGHGERHRPSSGWASLTPAELDVVRLVREGLGNKDIAARLFVSPRTVQAHLTHIYNKIGITSRMQLAQEAARHD